MPSTNPKDKKTKKSSFNFKQWLSKIYSGDFLLSPQTKVWYPYLLMLCLMAVILIVNTRIITNKTKEINSLESEYSRTIESVKYNNIYLDYNEKMKIKEIAHKRGFIDTDSNTYKITINNYSR